MKLKTIIISILACVVFTLPVQAEFVFLKNGSIIEGKVTADSADSITVRDKENKEKLIPRNSILRMLYTSLKLGKIYIQKRDGEGIVAFMVDEDRDSYTFRKELNKPDEFVLQRSDVLFIAEKNPSGLKGVAETDRVSLTWLPPYDSVKKYNVYYSPAKNEKYKLAGSTWSKSYTVKNLLSNKSYFIIVTSVDSDDYESSPSNELKITTKNIPPDKPVIISNEKLTTGGIKIKWNEATDIDGKVEKYRLYGTADDKKVIISELKKTEYTLKNDSDYSFVDLAAVDNTGDESEYASIIATDKDSSICFYPGILIPLGKFSDMYNKGYGGMIAFNEQNLFFNNFECGINIGFYYMRGKNLIDERDKDYENFMLAPFYITSAYDLKLSEIFRIKPLLSIGYAYLNANYKDASSPSKPDKNLQIYEPTVKAGLYTDCRFSDSLSLSIGCEYSTIIEKNGYMSFILVNAGLNYFF